VVHGSTGQWVSRSAGQGVSAVSVVQVWVQWCSGDECMTMISTT
jgi:hypothetical protein